MQSTQKNAIEVLDGSCRSLEVLDGLAMKLTDWAELGGLIWMGVDAGALWNIIADRKE